MIYYLCAVEWIRGSISGRNNDSPRIVLSRDLRVPFLLSCPSSRRAISNETDLTTRRGGRLVASWPSILNRSSESRMLLNGNFQTLIDREWWSKNRLKLFQFSRKTRWFAISSSSIARTFPFPPKKEERKRGREEVDGSNRFAPFRWEVSRSGQVLRSSGVERVWVIKYFRTGMRRYKQSRWTGQLQAGVQPVLSASASREYFREFPRGFFFCFRRKKLGFRVKRCRFTV